MNQESFQLEDEEEVKMSLTSSLQVICTSDELIQAKNDNELQIRITSNTEKAISSFKDPIFLQEYKTNQDDDDEKVQGEVLLQQLNSTFAFLEVPIGLLSNLLKLRNYALNYIIDDSGSMQSETNVLRKHAGRYMLQRFRFNEEDLNEHMTRWAEAEDRLHVIIELILLVPTQTITVRFLNRPNIIRIIRDGRHPKELIKYAHKEIEEAFKDLPFGATPTKRALQESFLQSCTPTIHALFTDGEPTDASCEEISELVLHRNKPEENPITFFSCTNDDLCTGWMKTLDEMGVAISEIDDFEDERREVIRKHGNFFPYTRGIWLLCLIAAVISPNDLDTLDESAPLSKYSLELIFGRKLSDQEYRKYFKNHPMSKEFHAKFERFSSLELSSKEILRLIH